MELTVVEDGRIFFIELEGLFNLLDPDDGRIQEVGKLTVTTEQENELIGLAMGPGFATTK